MLPYIAYMDPMGYESMPIASTSHVPHRPQRDRSEKSRPKSARQRRRQFIGILTSLPEFFLVLGKIFGLDSDMWQARAGTVGTVGTSGYPPASHQADFPPAENGFEDSPNWGNRGCFLCLAHELTLNSLR